jgi:hypothetical protein
MILSETGQKLGYIDISVLAIALIASIIFAICFFKYAIFEDLQ